MRLLKKGNTRRYIKEEVIGFIVEGESRRGEEMTRTKSKDQDNAWPEKETGD